MGVYVESWADPEGVGLGDGGQVVQNPLRNHKIYGVLAILVRIPLKAAKLPSQH